MTTRQIIYYLSGTLENLNTVNYDYEHKGEGLATVVNRSNNNSLISTLRNYKFTITAQEVLNVQHALRRQKYGPYTSTKIFIDLLKKYKIEYDIYYEVQYENSDDTSRVRRVFWTFR